MKRIIYLLLVSFGLCCVPSVSKADELLEAARREKARREALKKKRGETTTRKEEAPKTVLSNSDIKKTKDGGGSLSTVGREESGTAGEGDGPAAAAGTGEKSEAPASEGPDRTYWQTQMEKAEKDISDAQREVGELSEKLAGLRRMVSASDDPNIRLRSDGEMRKTESDLSAAQQKVADKRKALEDFRARARSEGVPPGWLR